jgi:drug/metabolite transporter (DMT)-like permease
MKALRSGLGAILVSTVGLSLKGIWARLAYESGFAVPDVLLYRALLSLPLVLLGGAVLHRGGEALLPRRRRDLFFALALGAFFSVGMYCDFQAIRSVGAGVSRVILFGFPLLVMGLESARLRRWPTRRSVLSFLVAWTGLWVIALGQASGGLPGNAGWALASLCCYALFVWLSGQLASRLGAARLTFLSNLATCVSVVSTMAIFHGQSFVAPAGEPLGWVLVMVLLSTVIPYYLMNEAMVRLGAARASLIAMSGPVVTLLAAYLVLDEELSAPQLFGSVALLAGVACVKPSPKAEKESGAERQGQPSGCSL